jgi:hypothetical protein
VGEVSGRRAVERFSVNANTKCTLFAPVAEDFGQAKIRDISRNGVGWKRAAGPVGPRSKAAGL